MEINWTDELQEFIISQRGTDPIQLVLQQKKYPQFDMKFVAQQVEGYRMALDKLPSIAQHNNFIYPPKLNREQCSSEVTATYKARTYMQNRSIADITGGLGIDSLFIAREAKSVVYIEENKELYDIASLNFKHLEQKNIHTFCSDGIGYLESSTEHFDIIYIDPARRNEHGKKVSAFEDCSPNILCNMDLLLSKADKVLIKSSPMLDISEAIRQLKYVEEITILSVKNECKELLFLCSKAHSTDHPKQHCVNIKTDGTIDTVTFTADEENELSIPYTSEIEEYIYDPNTSLSKAGAFKTLSIKYNIRKIHRNTHLYTSSERIDNFPGRIFKVIKEVKATATEIASTFPDRKAHVVTRNYPSTSQELQKKLRLKEGGDIYLIAFTKANDKKTVLLCSKIN
jgi:16S rRNA G966 N2-methylase RsmD